MGVISTIVNKQRIVCDKISSIGPSLVSMTSQNGGQDGRHGSKMADSNPRWRPSTDKGHDL